MQQLIKTLELLQLAEKLKFELRHSWLSNGRQESVAEHSWRMALMVILIAPTLEYKVNVEKSLKMAIIHDLVEAEAGDVPVFECQTNDAKQQKKQAELKAIERIKSILSNESGDEIYQLWHEFELCETHEAKFVKALDKCEVFLQHNHADLSTWLHQEKLMVFQPQWKQHFCEHDKALLTLHKLIKQMSIEKLIDADHDIDDLKKEAEDAL